MIETLCRMAETSYGIKTDSDNIERLLNHILSVNNNNSFDRIFTSGEAAAFLTVNETYFFREPLHFFLLKELLPSFDQSVIRICSAATSCGCEAYSIAMFLETYNTIAERPLSYQIDAFDINPNAIETACKGVFNQRSLRDDGSCFSHIYDMYLKRNDYNVYVDQNLKKTINFFVHNLLNEFKTDYYDIIFFRNAFIYFLPDYRDRVLTNLSNALKENGFLITGISETAGVKHRHLEQRIRRLLPQMEDVFFFQKNTYKKPAVPDYFTNAPYEKSAV